MLAKHMSGGINFQGPEENLYIFGPKKVAIGMLTCKKGCSWLSHTKPLVKKILVL